MSRPVIIILTLAYCAAIWLFGAAVFGPLIRIPHFTWEQLGLGFWALSLATFLLARLAMNAALQSIDHGRIADAWQRIHEALRCAWMISGGAACGAMAVGIMGGAA